MATRDFVQFLNSLSTDPILAAAFKQDADAVLSTSRLSIEERELLKSGNAAKIHEALSSTGETWGARPTRDSWAARVVINPWPGRVLRP